MIEHFIREHTLYKAAVFVFFVSACALAYAVYAGMNVWAFSLLFLLQIAVIIFLIMKATKQVQTEYQKEWGYILDHDVDPQRLLDKYLNDEKLQTYPEARANCAVYYYLLGDQTSAIMLTQDILGKEKRPMNQAMLYMNLAVFYEANQEYDMSKEAIKKCKEIIQTLESKHLLTHQVYQLKRKLNMLEMFYAYQDRALSEDEYEEFLKQKLQEEKNNRGKLQQHYRLALLYMDEGKLEFARDQVNQVMALGKKTYMAEETQLKLRKYMNAQEEKEGGHL